MIIIFLLRVIRKLFKIVIGLKKKILLKISNSISDPYKDQLYEKSVELFDQAANDYCREFLEIGRPTMISKFGTIELVALIQYKSITQSKYTLFEYIQFVKDKRPTLWWYIGIDDLCRNAGFFPNDSTLLKNFYNVYYNALSEIDILGSYLEGENYFGKELSLAKKVNLDGYYAPFLFINPWTKVLKGKKVLVIHPFEKSIQNQYKRKELIWENSDVLPDFELLTIKAVQTISYEPSNFSTWFEALESMKIKMAKTDFDIVLIGAGAYGMPLAAYAKGLGKQAVHLAGWTQVLFGIKGKRWVDIPSVAKFINDYWVDPLPEEIPKNYKKIENGCYW